MFCTKYFFIILRSYLLLLKPITGTCLNYCFHCFFTPSGDIWKFGGYGCCFNKSPAVDFCFSLTASMNRSTKLSGFLSTKYTGSYSLSLSSLNVSRTATLISMCLDEYVRSSVGCSLSGTKLASKSYTKK